MFLSSYIILLFPMHFQIPYVSQVTRFLFIAFHSSHVSESERFLVLTFPKISRSLVVTFPCCQRLAFRSYRVLQFSRSSVITATNSLVVTFPSFPVITFPYSLVFSVFVSPSSPAIKFWRSLVTTFLLSLVFKFLGYHVAQQIRIRQFIPYLL